MKKFGRFLGELFALVFMAAAISVIYVAPIQFLFNWLSDAGWASALHETLGKTWFFLTVAGGLGLITAVVMRVIPIRRLKLLWAVILGAVLYGGLYFVYTLAVKNNPLLFIQFYPESLVEKIPESGDYILLGISGGLYVIAILIAALCRKSRGKERSGSGKAPSAKKERAAVSSNNTSDAAPAYEQTTQPLPSRNTDPKPKAQRYVRDPWGNLITEEDYNKRIDDIRNKK
ncbi:MAG: hypothetical protein LBS99_05875 [Clostridiales bacterium]|jgi:hypothetical protein|nr:hypothetical protein [Clostridiales bacterium]